MSLATFSTVVSGVVVATTLTITSLALISLSSRHVAELSASAATALMWINATFPEGIFARAALNVLSSPFRYAVVLGADRRLLQFPKRTPPGFQAGPPVRSAHGEN
jgi:hypothetical protein